MENPSDVDFSGFSPESGTNLAHNVDNDVFLQMVYISPGSFRMGVPVNRQNDSAEIQPTMIIRKFYMGQSPITPAQYTSVMGDSDGMDDCKLPLALISWFGARTFCQKLSDLTQRQYRLPSEVEWGYACLLANEFGLRDIHRDNWEWCDQSRGEGLTAGIEEIKKTLDGAWYVSPDLSSGSDRNVMPTDHRYLRLGFRVVLADGY